MSDDTLRELTSNEIEVCNKCFDRNKCCIQNLGDAPDEFLHNCMVMKYEILKLENKKLREGLIFYSDDYQYLETHDQLDWSLVNNPAAIQDKGKRARNILKELTTGE